VNEWKYNSDGEFDVRIYGRKVQNQLPNRLVGYAEDAGLVSRYGKIEKTIDNPLIQSYSIAQKKAENELKKIKARQKKIELKLPANMLLQVGKKISVYHPTYQSYITLYIYSIQHKIARGSEDFTKVSCFYLS
jgi:hypothetical protein